MIGQECIHTLLFKFCVSDAYVINKDTTWNCHTYNLKHLGPLKYIIKTLIYYLIFVFEYFRNDTFDLESIFLLTKSQLWLRIS